MTKAAASSDHQMLAVFEALALEAGRAIMGVFDAGMRVRRKLDHSPVTDADRQSEELILAGLRSRFPDIPCVAEEEVAEGVRCGDLGASFFLIDPLDGTKEFVNRHTDFTVNIALVRDGVPALGAVFAPCTRRFYCAGPGLAERADVTPSFELTGRRRIVVREGRTPLTIVASRSHRTAATDAFIRTVEAAEIISVGSSLKFCLIASGEADIYPRFGPTMEWDTAAGDAILRAAGGSTRTIDGQPLRYGKRGADDADFANPDFIARGL